MLNFGYSLGAAETDVGFRITSLKEIVAGSCEYPSGSTCVATSTMQVTVEKAIGSVSYVWTVTNGTIESGDGTDTITVFTDSDKDEDVDIKCEVTDSLTTVSRQVTITQERTRLNYFLQLVNKVDFLTLFDKVSKLILARSIYSDTQTPCMTSDTTPYGILSASSQFSNDYRPLEGMNCAVSSSNAWISAVKDTGDVPTDGNARGEWFEWKLTQDNISSGMPEMIPTWLEITPRGGMTASWYHDRNPKAIEVFGIKSDDSFEAILSEDLPDWNNGASRSWDIVTNTQFKGFRLYVTKVNWEDSDGSYNTGFSNLVMKGVAPTP